MCRKEAAARGSRGSCGEQYAHGARESGGKRAPSEDSEQGGENQRVARVVRPGEVACAVVSERGAPDYVAVGVIGEAGSPHTGALTPALNVYSDTYAHQRSQQGKHSQQPLAPHAA